MIATVGGPEPNNHSRTEGRITPRLHVSDAGRSYPNGTVRKGAFGKYLQDYANFTRCFEVVV